MIAVTFSEWDRGQLERAIDSAPRYDSFACAIRHAIKIIHGVPTLFHDIALNELDVYVGRTAAAAGSLRGRWRDGEGRRDHEHGVVLFRCPTEKVRAWEAAANRLVTLLRTRRALCVANVHADGRGPLPDADESCVYLTFRLGRRRVCSAIERAALDEIAALVADGDASGPSVDSIRRAIDPLSNRRCREELEWADDPDDVSA